jgi:hypothetical protein
VHFHGHLGRSDPRERSARYGCQRHRVPSR